MSQNSEITTNDIKCSLDDENDNFQQLISCKCGNFHVFSIEYIKGFKLAFFCNNKFNSINLIDAYNNKDYCIKCKECENPININKDYFKIIDKKLKFKCENCILKKKKKNKYIKLSEYKYEINNNIGNSVINKLNNLIKVNNKKQLTEFYIENLNEKKQLDKFLNYLLFVLRFFPKDSKIEKIIINFFKYLNYMIDIASKNILLFDIYHFKKECNIYADDYKEEFLSENFNKFYSELLKRCSKQKFLSIEMLKFVHKNLYNLNLSLPLNKYILIDNYIKKKDNIKKKIYDIIFKIKKYYLDLELFETKINYELRILSLENEIKEITGNLKIDKYYDSFFEKPGDFALIRKNINLILDRIIKKNFNKLNYNQPNIKIIKLSFGFISKLKNKLNTINTNNKNDLDLINNIKNKLKELEIILTKYQNFLNKNLVKEKISKLNLPLIYFNENEKKFLKENIINFTDRNFKNFIQSNEDKILEIIINYLYELKEIGNETIHISDKDKIKFYCFSKNIEINQQPDNDDSFKEALDKIKYVIKIQSNVDNLTYENLVDYTFNNPINKLMVTNDKIKYLLSFLNIKKNKLKEIKEKFDSFKKKMELKSSKILDFLNFINPEHKLEKFNNFIKKYEIKNDYNKIIDYLNVLINFSMPKFNQSNEDSDDEEDEKIFSNLMERESKIMKEEEKLRNEINIIVEKEPKFIEYIEIYLNHYFYEYVNSIKNNYTEKINIILKDIKSQKLISYKLDKIIEIINDLKLYNFNIKEHFNNFMEENLDKLPSKIKIIDKDNIEKINFTFKDFIEKLKGYLGNSQEKVEMFSEDPNEFMFRLFRLKIGLDFD